MNFCSNCGSNQLDFKIPQGDSLARWCCNNCSAIHYQNPKIVVACIPYFNDKVLLAKRNIAPRFGLWNLPAGFMENNEKTEEGALRELKEETDAVGKIIDLYCIYNLPKANQVYIFYLVKLDKEYAIATAESSVVGFFKKEEIPWKEMAFTSSVFALNLFFENGHNRPKNMVGSYPDTNP